MKRSILLIEKDADLSDYLQEALGQEGFTVKPVPSGIEGLNQLDSFIPDLILLDRELPDTDSTDIAQKIQEEHPHLPIIAMMEKPDVSYAARLIRSGADDFITKPISLESLLTRIEILLSDKRGSGSLLQVADLTLDLETFTVTRGDEKIGLTPKEFSLLKFLMKNSGRVLTRDVILNRVWTYPIDIDSRVVDVYIGYLRKKIDNGRDTKLIHTVRGFGYTVKIA